MRILICISLLAMLIGTACENDPSEIRRWVSQMETDVEEAEDVEILYSDSSVVRVRIKAPTLLIYTKRDEEKREFPDGLEVDFFDHHKQPQSRLTAKYAIQYQKENKVIARDSVILTGSEGQQLESEELIWDENERKIYTKKFAVLKTKEEVIWGFDFEANQDFSVAKIKRVQGRLPAIKGLENETSE